MENKHKETFFQKFFLIKIEFNGIYLRLILNINYWHLKITKNIQLIYFVNIICKLM